MNFIFCITDNFFGMRLFQEIDKDYFQLHVYMICYTDMNQIYWWTSKYKFNTSLLNNLGNKIFKRTDRPKLAAMPIHKLFVLSLRCGLWYCSVKAGCLSLQMLLQSARALHNTDTCYITCYNTGASGRVCPWRNWDHGSNYVSREKRLQGSVVTAEVLQWTIHPGVGTNILELILVRSIDPKWLI